MQDLMQSLVAICTISDMEPQLMGSVAGRCQSRPFVYFFLQNVGCLWQALNNSNVLFSDCVLRI